MNVASYLLLLCVSSFGSDIYMRKRMEKPRRISCSSNLKQLMLALEQYAIDYKGHYPNLPDAQGFEILRSQNYLTDYKIYECPSSEVSRSSRQSNSFSLPLTDDMTDYLYLPGATVFDSPRGTLIALDKPGKPQGLCECTDDGGRNNQSGRFKMDGTGA